MTGLVDRLFLAHPRTVEETYGEHFMFALKFGMTLLIAGLAAIVHAFLPFLFEKTASTTVKRIYPRIANRGAAPVNAPAQAVLADFQI